MTNLNVPEEPAVQPSPSFSIAIASTFWVSIAAAIVAAVIVLYLREQPMRETLEMAEPASPDASAA